MVELTRGAQMIKYTPLEYIQIDIANHFGINDAQFEERIQWVIDHDLDLESSTLNFAKDKYRYGAAVMAYRDVQAASGPTGHMVGLDAAASGIAILGALTGCPTTAHNTGITGTKRKDIYGKCTSVMSNLLGSGVDVTRKEVKKALMCGYYGSTAEPKNAFGEDTPELHAFYQAAETVAPGASMLKDTLLQAWQPYVLEHSWVMPDDFHVHLPVLQTMETKIEIDELDHTCIKMLYEDNVGTERGLSLVANFTHANDSLMVREVSRRCNYNNDQLFAVYTCLMSRVWDHNTEPSTLQPAEQLWRDHGFMSLVHTETITMANVSLYTTAFCQCLADHINTVRSKPSFDILAIHDEYLCHPNYMNYVRQTVIDVLAEMADSNIASCVLSQITGQEVVVPKLSDNLGDAIRESEYIIN